MRRFDPKWKKDSSDLPLIIGSVGRIAACVVGVGASSMDDDNLDRVLAGLPDEFFDHSGPPQESAAMAGSKRRAEEIVLDDDEDAVVSDREQATVSNLAATHQVPSPPPPLNDSEEPIKAGASSLSSYIEKLLLEASTGSSGPMVLDASQRKALDAALAGANMYVSVSS